MSVVAEEPKVRTKDFAVRVIRACESLPGRPGSRVITRQLIRSGTSVAANYRAACRARSKAEFVAKLGIVIEEADETVFWIELLRDAGIVADRKIAPLLDEANQLVAIFTASRRTAEASLNVEQQSAVGNRQWC